jgi:1-acyl-sn-glycerol-3-phosphate acyltransferase
MRGSVFRGSSAPVGFPGGATVFAVCLARPAMAKLLSLLYWLFVAGSSVTMFWGALVLWLLTVAFDRRLALLHGYTSFWGSLYTWCNPLWSVKVAGREKIDPRRTYVMAANHLSLVDIFVLFRLFRHFKWVSKIENFRLPFIGWNMALNRYIALRRGDRDSVVKMFDACRQTLAAGNSIMMFPEGTRSRTGELQAFKPGAFELALEAKVPVLPIVLEGSHRALPKKGFTIRRADIRVTVLDPIEVDAYGPDDVENLSADVRERFVEFLRRPNGG